MWKAWWGDEQIMPDRRHIEQFFLDLRKSGVSYEMGNKARCFLVFTENMFSQDQGNLIMSQPWVQILLQGWERSAKIERAEGVVDPDDIRTWPLTWIDIKRERMAGWKTLTAALAIMGYSFLLRWSEAVGLQKGNVKVTMDERGRARLMLRYSKTDQMHEGCTVVFNPDELPGDMVTEIKWAMEVLGSAQVWPPQGEVNKELRRHFGVQARFHCGRHGRCSDLAASGVAETRIQELGRWSSKRAMRLYVHAVSMRMVPNEE